MQLPCPECLLRRTLRGGRVVSTDPVIGARARRCGTCNRYNATVRRIALARLREAHSDEWRALVAQAQRDQYPLAVEDYYRRAGWRADERATV